VTVPPTPAEDGRPLPRVLIVDDEPPIRELLAMVCRYEGWEVGTAEAGAPAIRWAAEHGPDVVLLDLMLPDVDGLEVVRRLRAELPGAAVVVVTALDSTRSRAAAREAGAIGYVTKPFCLDELIGEVRRHLGEGAVPVALPCDGH
jgi:two-component system, OmpR family, response regulator